MNPDLRNPPTVCLVLQVGDERLALRVDELLDEEEVVATVDGMDALDALGHRSFAAVVSDIVMPNMDGLTLTARIRQF